MNAPILIDFSKYNGPVYTGRDRGERLRSELKLDAVDQSGDPVDVSIPENTYTVTSSFFLGLFGPSVLKAGSKDEFYRQYRFKVPAFLRPDVDGYVARALQGRNLFS
ncbi:MAG: hypothetical protein AB7I35_18820 [Ramlibacter sp.]